jgi:hypothetical protein
MPRLRYVVLWGLSGFAMLANPGLANDATNQPNRPGPLFGLQETEGPELGVVIANAKQASSGWDNFVEPDGVIVQPITQPPQARIARQPERDMSPASVLQLEPENTTHAETAPAPATVAIPEAVAARLAGRPGSMPSASGETIPTASHCLHHSLAHHRPRRSARLSSMVTS